MFDDPQPDACGFANFYSHGWFDYSGCSEKYPSTKAVRCLLHDLGIEPIPELLGYSVQVGSDARERVERYVAWLPRNKGFAVIHYEGNTSSRDKNLPHEVIMPFCWFLMDNGYTPVILDWDHRSPLPDNSQVYCPDSQNALWMGHGTGDAETIAALIDRASLFVGIDSGPQKVAMSRETPSIGVWTRLHPINYADHSAMTHLVPYNHADYIRGPRGVGLEYFLKHYEFYEYCDLITDLCAVAGDRLKIAPLKRNPMSRHTMLTAFNFDREYYEEHKEAGLDYLGHGIWQEEYGRWLCEVFDLRGKHLLDIGCAAGSIAYGLKKSGIIAYGIDLNNHTIQLGKHKFAGLPLYVCDACNMHLFGDDSFDFVHTNQVAEHWKPELVPFIFAEVYRVLKPGGIFFTVLDTLDLFQRQNRIAEAEDKTNRCVKPMEWWADRTRGAGFEEQDAYIPQLQSHPLSFLTRYDWDLFVVRKPQREVP